MQLHCTKNIGELAPRPNPIEANHMGATSFFLLHGDIFRSAVYTV